MVLRKTSAFSASSAFLSQSAAVRVLSVFVFPSSFCMADSNSSSTMIVALVAILVIVALGFLLYKQLPMGTTPADNNGINVDVDLPGNSASSY